MIEAFETLRNDIVRRLWGHKSLQKGRKRLTGSRLRTITG